MATTAALLQNPAFLAFITSAGLEDELVAADVAREQGLAKMALGIQDEQAAESGMRQRRDIKGSQEARGVLRSGQTGQRVEEQESDEGRLRALMQINAANRLSGLDTQLGQQIAGTQLEGAQTGIGAASDLFGTQTSGTGSLGSIGLGSTLPNLQPLPDVQDTAPGTGTGHRTNQPLANPSLITANKKRTTTRG